MTIEHGPLRYVILATAVEAAREALYPNYDAP